MCVCVCAVCVCVAPLCLRHCRNWAAIAAELPNKTEPQCKNFYHNNKRRLNLEVLYRHDKLVCVCACVHVCVCV